MGSQRLTRREALRRLGVAWVGAALVPDPLAGGVRSDPREGEILIGGGRVVNATGSAVYQWASSLAGNPVVSLPLMAVDGLPLGLQVQGFVAGEESLMAACRWLDAAFRAGEI